ncbi:glycoside hydrolase family 19 protein [Aquipseudomonas guryensis]|uniref:Chitinase n=1 Tax=Aquipseudomonas guryensis TaxID=2759165 RepID=A0A7W4D9P1_9GAMM|nr:hypothetical protein [Pseudomonas guryensis]MBB1518555.1 hypothetical protein [Pseudomonas guryensis]
MADHKPINWAFPFKLKGADGAASKDITNPEVYYAALAQAKDGFYPMGASGNWHGGVHFDEATGAVLDQSEVHCIADGEVIAYRIDEQYPTTTYGEVPAVVHLPFSTGFVLVKHRLELPPKPLEPAAGAASETPPAAPALTFYSLYMHLQDWASYQAQPTLPRPSFWVDGLCKVKADAPDKLLGLNVRAYYKVSPTNAHHSEYENILATLPRGTIVEAASGPDNEHAGWLKLTSITPAIAGLEPENCWAYKDEMKSLGSNRYLISEGAKDPIAPVQQGLNVRSATAHGDILALLPRGTQLRISNEGAAGKYRKLVEIISGTAVPPLTADSSGNLPGFVWLDSLEVTHEPKAHDGSVVVLDQPVAIKAGELIGHIGQYQNFDDNRPRSMLHLEVFSCNDVPAFISQSRAWAESLPAEQKTLIKIHKESKVIQPTAADTQIASGTDVKSAADSPTEGCWTKVQPYVVLKVNKSELGTYSSKQYPLNASQKSTLAGAQGIDVSELPDQVDFLMETYLADGTDPQPYVSGSIPATRPMRKIGVKLNTPVWVKRSTLNAQGQRSSTDGALDAWKNFPLSQATDGPACGFERILSKASWNHLSTDHKAVDANTEKTHWWYVTVASAAGQEISGWVPEVDLIVTEHSPWEWPGFSQIEDITPVVSQQAQALSAQGALSTEEAHSYAAQIDEAERGALFQRLFEIIDQPDAAGVRDKKLTPAEIKNALSKSWLAQQLSLLITHYESEWFSNPAKWNALDSLMAYTPGQSNSDWEKEKQRIEKLSWWATLTGKHGTNTHGKVWHFHAAGLIGSLLSPNTFKITIEMLRKIFTSGSIEKLQLLADELNKNLAEYKLDTPARLSHFFAQVRVEVGDNYSLVESLKYRPEKLSDFSYFASRPDEAQLYGYIPGVHPANEVEIANRAYNGVTGNSDLGNGDIESGDGWKFRGRGLKQLTGRYNYTDFNQKYSILWTDENINFIENPEKLEETKYAARSAVYFWLKNSLYEIADLGVEPSNVNSITAVINQYTSSYAERRNQFKRIWEIEKIFR